MSRMRYSKIITYISTLLKSEYKSKFEFSALITSILIICVLYPQENVLTLIPINQTGTFVSFTCPIVVAVHVYRTVILKKLALQTRNPIYIYGTKGLTPLFIRS